MTALEELIAQQQKGHEDKPRYMIGEQLKEIAARDPRCAELLERDLAIAEMSLEAAEKKLKEYADKNRKGASVFCITPIVAEKILREFYGLPQQQTAEDPQPVAEADYIDLSSFL